MNVNQRRDAASARCILRLHLYAPSTHCIITLCLFDFALTQDPPPPHRQKQVVQTAPHTSTNLRACVNLQPEQLRRA